jgi:hypothetical protein
MSGGRAFLNAGVVASLMLGALVAATPARCRMSRQHPIHSKGSSNDYANNFRW